MALKLYNCSGSEMIVMSGEGGEGILGGPGKEKTVENKTSILKNDSVFLKNHF